MLSIVDSPKNLSIVKEREKKKVTRWKRKKRARKNNTNHNFWIYLCWNQQWLKHSVDLPWAKQRKNVYKLKEWLMKNQIMPLRREMSFHSIIGMVLIQVSVGLYAVFGQFPLLLYRSLYHFQIIFHLTLNRYAY